VRRLTVLQLLPALEAGGVERTTVEVARALVAAGHRSIVASAGGRLVETLRAEGSEHVTLDIGRKSLFTPFRTPALRALIRALAPDVVHARSRLPAWVARAALATLPADHRPSFLTSVHGLNSPGRYSGVLTRGDRVHCVSQTVRAHVLRQWPDTPAEKLVVIEPGIEPGEFPRGLAVPDAWRAQLHARHPQLAGGHVLMLPGRGTRLKGHHAALDLLAGLRKDGLDARLWLPGVEQRGREAYLAELRARIAALGLQDAVATSEPRADIALAYAASAVVLQLSAQPESFGRTVVEALAIGRPVLGWAHGGVGELLAEHFSVGAVALGDMAGLQARAAEFLRAPPTVPVTLLPTRAAMEARMLELYANLA
jgi:glycosyltransferase involved in cell wall biosynthesis